MPPTAPLRYGRPVLNFTHKNAPLGEFSRAQTIAPSFRTVRVQDTRRLGAKVARPQPIIPSPIT